MLKFFSVLFVIWLPAVSSASESDSSCWPCAKRKTPVVSSSASSAVDWAREKSGSRREYSNPLRSSAGEAKEEKKAEDSDSSSHNGRVLVPSRSSFSGISRDFSQRVSSVLMGKSRREVPLSSIALQSDLIPLLENPRSFKNKLQSTRLVWEGTELPDNLERFSQVFLIQYINKPKTRIRKGLERGYGFFAMLGSQGATWNAYANQVLWKSLGIFKGGYAAYDSSVSTADWTVMILLNLWVIPTLCLTTGGQTLQDAQWVGDKIAYRPHLENRSCIGNVWDCVRAPFSSSLPRVQHWSEQWIVFPLVVGFSLVNTIPEMLVVMQLMKETSNPATKFGLPFAFTQRVGSQMGALSPMIHRYHKILATKEDQTFDNNIQFKREQLATLLTNCMYRIQGKWDLQKINSLYNVIFSRGVGPQAPHFITAEGVMATFLALGGGHAQWEKDVNYQEPNSRKFIKLVAGGIGAWGTIAASMIIEEGLSGIFEYFGADSETSKTGTKIFASIFGACRGVSMINSIVTYWTRMYDACTGNDHYKKSGLINPHFSNVIYGKAEPAVLLINFAEGGFWSLLYWAVGAPILQERGLNPFPLIVPTIVAQAAFEAIQMMQNRDPLWHEAQVARASPKWKRVVDWVCCCVRGKRKCTESDHFTGTDRIDLKKATRAYTLLEAMNSLKEALEVAPSHVIKDFYKFYVKNNPLLKSVYGEKDNLETKSDAAQPEGPRIEFPLMEKDGTRFPNAFVEEDEEAVTSKCGSRWRRRLTNVLSYINPWNWTRKTSATALVMADTGSTDNAADEL